MLPFTQKATLTLALAISTTSAFAAPDAATAKIAPNLAGVLNGTEIEKITATPYAGLFEVLTPNGILYTDKNGSFVVHGPIIDTASKTNITKKSFDALGAFDFKNLPLKDAIKVVKGDGSRVIATFEDPNCGFCKKFMKELEQVDNITIYTFLIPILGPESVAKSNTIWCSASRSSVWTSYMSGKTPIQSSSNAMCETPFERNEKLRRTLRITGTPTILFQNNTKEPGFVSAAALEAKLKQ